MAAGRPVPYVVVVQDPSPLDSLVRILRLAYSGELAASLAYAGHWRSARRESERLRIREIELEEIHHRELVGGMLAELGFAPDASRERRAKLIGTILGALCHVAGRFAPIYGAGRLESRNIREYETAARFAALSGNARFVDCILTMAEVEWEHEHYFRGALEGHPLLRLVPLWPPPPAKTEIRASFAREHPEVSAA